jgi:hypothetical protein
MCESIGFEIGAHTDMVRGMLGPGARRYVLLPGGIAQVFV